MQSIGVGQETKTASHHISDREGIEALEGIEKIIFGRNRTEARTIGRKNLVAQAKEPFSFEGKRLLYAQHTARKISESEIEYISQKFEVLQEYFEQRSEFLAASWRVEKQAMRIKMTLLIVRTKVRGEFFLPG